MSTARSGPQRPSLLQGAAFTLLETLIVITLAALLLTLSVGGFQGMIAAQRLASAATTLENELRLAASMAVKENRAIYLRFVKSADLSTGGPPQYRGWQLVALDPATGGLQDLARQQLPEGVIIFDHPDYANILQLQPAAGPSLVLGFTQAGSTTLPKTTGGRWCLTLIEESKITTAADKPPKNYRTLVINAHTGGVAVY